jgi:hypothetical protein
MALQIANNFPYISQVALHLTILFLGFYIKRKLYQLLGNYWGAFSFHPPILKSKFPLKWVIDLTD